MAAHGKTAYPTLDGVTWGDSEDGNIPISNYDDENDSEGSLPPEYSPENVQDHDSTYDYTTYDTKVLDDEYEPSYPMSNSEYTYGSTDIVVSGQPSPVAIPSFAPAQFKHPLSQALAASIIDEGTYGNKIDDSEYTDDFMGDDNYDSHAVDPIGATTVEPHSKVLEDAIAAGSALSAVRSRSQGNPAPSDHTDFATAIATHEYLKAAVAIVGDVATGLPSAKALQSLQRAEASNSQDGSHNRSEKRSKIADIRRGRLSNNGTNSVIATNGEDIKSEEVDSKAKALSRQERESSLERTKSDSTKVSTQRRGKLEPEPEPEETEEEKLMRKEAAKALKNKTASMLATIAEQKAKEAEEKKRKEEALKKRKAILTARVVAEAAERRSMGMEDKERYRPSTEGGQSMGARESKKARDAEEAKAAEINNKGLSKEKTEEMVARVKARQAKLAEGLEQVAMSVPARDFNDWKRKNSVPKDGLVFAMTGWYPCVKQALLDRGWYFNSDPASPYFDLKWTLRSLECDQDALQSWQLTNHFMKNIAITTKVGLIKSLRSLIWLADVHTNDVIPRGYDLSVNSEMQAFIDDFRCQHSLNLLKDLFKRVTGISFPVKSVEVEMDFAKKENSDDDSEEGYYYEEESALPPTPRMLSGDEAIQEEESDDVEEEKVMLFKTMGTNNGPEDADDANDAEDDDGPVIQKKMKTVKRKKPKGPGGDKTVINAGVFACCCAVLERSLRPTDEKYLDVMEAECEPTIGNSAGWNTGTASSNVGAGALDKHAIISALQWEIISGYDIYSEHTLPEQGLEPVDAFIPKETDESENEISKVKGSNTTGANSILNQQRLLKEKRRKEAIEKKERGTMSVALHDMRTVSKDDVSRMYRILQAYFKRDKAQAGLNGTGSIAKNIWIVKPGAKSRGRGISTFADLAKLLKYVDAGTGSAQASQWVVQKYIENPLIISKHKFDLRQWVLVTDWNPLTIYFYDECYARFSVEEYTTSDEGLENAYVHLVNNSISKKNERFHIPLQVPGCDDIEGFMWSFDSFSSFLQKSTGRDMMKDKIQPRMKDIAKWSLMCASECIEHRKNSWELYGFDFMVDDNYNAWLIEINSSPACDYSTKVTERYVQKALVELLSVTLDMREWEKKSKNARGEKPDTGGWLQLHKGPFLEMPTTAFGADMTLKGDAMRPPKKKVPPNVRLGYDPSTARGIITNGQGEVMEGSEGPPQRNAPQPPKEQVPHVQPFPNRRQMSQSRTSATAPATSTRENTLSNATAATSPVRISNDVEPLNTKYGTSAMASTAVKQQSTAVKQQSHSSNGATIVGHKVDVNASLEGSLMNDSIDSANGMDLSLNDSDDDSRRSKTGKHVGRGFPRGRSLSPAPISSNIGLGMGIGVAAAPVTKRVEEQHRTIAAAAVANRAILTDDELLASERKENVDARQKVRELREQRAKDIVAARKAPVPPVGRESAPVKAKVFELPF